MSYLPYQTVGTQWVETTSYTVLPLCPRENRKRTEMYRHFLFRAQYLEKKQRDV